MLALKLTADDIELTDTQNPEKKTIFKWVRAFFGELKIYQAVHLSVIREFESIYLDHCNERDQVDYESGIDATEMCDEAKLTPEDLAGVWSRAMKDAGINKEG